MLRGCGHVRALLSLSAPTTTATTTTSTATATNKSSSRDSSASLEEEGEEEDVDSDDSANSLNEDSSRGRRSSAVAVHTNGKEGGSGNANLGKPPKAIYKRRRRESKDDAHLSEGDDDSEGNSEEEEEEEEGGMYDLYDDCCEDEPLCKAIKHVFSAAEVEPNDGSTPHTQQNMHGPRKKQTKQGKKKVSSVLPLSLSSSLSLDEVFRNYFRIVQALLATGIMMRDVPVLGDDDPSLGGTQDSTGSKVITSSATRRSKSSSIINKGDRNSSNKKHARNTKASKENEKAKESSRSRSQSSNKGTIAKEFFICLQCPCEDAVQALLSSRNSRSRSPSSPRPSSSPSSWASKKGDTNTHDRIRSNKKKDKRTSSSTLQAPTTPVCQYSPKHFLFVALPSGQTFCNSCENYVLFAEAEAVRAHAVVCSHQYHVKTVLDFPGDLETIIVKTNADALLVNSTAEAGQNVEISSKETASKTPASLRKGSQMEDLVHFPGLGLRGICNLGNTCFMNSVIQALAHVPELQLHFLSGFHALACPESGRLHPNVPPTLYRSPSTANSSDTEMLSDLERANNFEFYQGILRRDWANEQDPRVGANHASCSSGSHNTSLNDETDNKRPKHPTTNICFGCELDFVISTMATGANPSEPLVLSHLLKNLWKSLPGLGGYLQQDAHEFLGAIVNEVHAHTCQRLGVSELFGRLEGTWEQCCTATSSHHRLRCASRTGQGSEGNTKPQPGKSGPPHKRRRHSSSSSSSSSPTPPTTTTSSSSPTLNVLAPGSPLKRTEQSSRSSSSCSRTTASDGFKLSVASPSHAGTGDRLHCNCVVHNALGGVLKSEIKCITCGDISSKFEPFFDISLDVSRTVHNFEGKQHHSLKNGSQQDEDEGEDEGKGEGKGEDERKHISLLDCLDHFVSSEEMLGEERVICSSCKARRDSRKSMLIYSAPPNLVFHLKRFHAIDPKSDFSKVERPVGFPIRNLDLKPYASLDACSCTATHSDDCLCCMYDLRAVVQHSGRMDGGHYVAFIKHIDHWYLCDDAIITRASEEDVLKSQAYLLLYRKAENCVT